MHTRNSLQNLELGSKFARIGSKLQYCTRIIFRGWRWGGEGGEGKEGRGGGRSCFLYIRLECKENMKSLHPRLNSIREDQQSPFKQSRMKGFNSGAKLGKAPINMCIHQQ
jgi:hypothetical protein